jgi:hypothetical protein
VIPVGSNPKTPLCLEIYLGSSCVYPWCSASTGFKTRMWPCERKTDFVVVCFFSNLLAHKLIKLHFFLFPISFSFLFWISKIFQWQTVGYHHHVKNYKTKTTTTTMVKYIFPPKLDLIFKMSLLLDYYIWSNGTEKQSHS